VTADEIAVLAQVLGVSPSELLAPHGTWDRERIWDIADALADTGLGDDHPSRLLLQLIEEQLGRQLSVSDHSIGGNWLTEIVRTCAGIQDGMAALVSAISILWPRSNVYVRVRELAEQQPVRGLLPAPHLQQVQALLGDVAIPQLPALAYRAVGREMPSVRPASTAGEAFSYLVDFPAGSDGVPPALLFIALVSPKL